MLSRIQYILLGFFVRTDLVMLMFMLFYYLKRFHGFINTIMLEQFQNILQQQSNTQQELYYHTRSLILNAIEAIFPPEHNFEGLASICQDPNIASNQALLTYHLVDYFTQLVQLNFVSIHNYEALQSQTQKLEATIRSHIRLEQQVKIYLEHLEGKVAKYQNYLKNQAKSNNNKLVQFESSFEKDETKLRRQRISLIRTNQQLKRQLEEKENILKKYAEEKENQERLKPKKKLLISRSEHKIEGKQKNQNTLEVAERKQILRKEQNQKDFIMINISGNNNEVNYFIKP